MTDSSGTRAKTTRAAYFFPVSHATYFSTAADERVTKSEAPHTFAHET